MKRIILFISMAVLTITVFSQELLQKNRAYVRYLIKPCTQEDGLFHSKDSVYLYKEKISFTNDIILNPITGWVDAVVCFYYPNGNNPVSGYKGPALEPIPRNFSDYKKMILSEQDFSHRRK